MKYSYNTIEIENNWFTSSRRDINVINILLLRIHIYNNNVRIIIGTEYLILKTYSHDL